MSFQRKKDRGVTLAEILVSLVLLTGAIMTASMVFPNTFRLNMRTQQSLKAEKTAAGILEELRTLPWSLTGDATPCKSLLCIQSNPTDFGGWTPKTMQLLSQADYNAGKAGFILNGTKSKVTIEGSRYARITLVLQWKESTRGKTINREVQLTGSRAINHE